MGRPRAFGVGAFGLRNAVFAIGDTFLEVVAPVRDDTTAGRYLERRGGDGGYMALFQVPDVADARRRVADLGESRVQVLTQRAAQMNEQLQRRNVERRGTPLSHRMQSLSAVNTYV